MITGTHVAYYYHCQRHLWLYAKGIRYEDNSEDVKIGKLISEMSYDRKIHDIRITDNENDIAIDFYCKKKKVIHEVKKSKSMDELHIWQVKYYIYVLERIGISGVCGEIDYPKQKRVLKVELTEQDKALLRESIKNIENILTLATPPPVINKPYCKKCSYYEFCYC